MMPPGTDRTGRPIACEGASNRVLGPDEPAVRRKLRRERGKDYVLAELDGRTIEQALAEGVGAKEVWQAVCATFDVPQKLR